MTIVFFTHYSNLHGANKSLIELVLGLKEHGIRAVIFCPFDGPLIPELKTKNIEYQIFPFLNSTSNIKAANHFKSLQKLLINLILLPKLYLTVRKFKPKIIYTNSSCLNIGLALAKLMRIPHFWHIREFGKLDYDLVPDFGNCFFNFCLNQSDQVIAISDCIKQHVLSKVKAKLAVIWNGVFSDNSIELFKENRKARMESQDVFTFCILSQISKNKFQEEALRAIAILKSKKIASRLIIVGNLENHYGEYLQSLAVQLRIQDSVDFFGFVHDPYQVLFNADALITCSRYEAMGRVSAEAMASGIPVVGFNSYGTSELVKDHFNGLLYTGNEVDLAKKMIQIIEDRELYFKLATQAAETANENFTREIYSQKIFNLISDSVR